MPLTAGDRLGPYEIAGFIGAANGQMFFAGFEARSNVWMAERRDGATAR